MKRITWWWRLIQTREVQRKRGWHRDRCGVEEYATEKGGQQMKHAVSMPHNFMAFHSRISFHSSIPMGHADWSDRTSWHRTRQNSRTFIYPQNTFESIHKMNEIVIDVYLGDNIEVKTCKLNWNWPTNGREIIKYIFKIPTFALFWEITPPVEVMCKKLGKLNRHLLLKHEGQILWDNAAEGRIWSQLFMWDQFIMRVSHTCHEMK